MSNIAIRVENVGKLYRIGPCEHYKALRDTLTDDAMYAPFRRIHSTFQRANGPCLWRRWFHRRPSGKISDFGLRISDLKSGLASHWGWLRGT